MRLNRFICQFNPKDKVMLISNPELVNQIRRVLRLQVGEQIILCDGKSREALVKITEIGNNIKTQVIEINENKSESSVYGILYCAVLKKENFEWVCQKATEVGVKEITPIITQRTVKLNLKHDRLQKILKEAVEQSGRSIIPILNPIIDLKTAIEQAKNNNLNIIFEQSGESFKNLKLETKKVGIFIGPEGGWDEKEIKFAKENGFIFASMGKTTLRAETAAIIASYLVEN